MNNFEMMRKRLEYQGGVNQEDRMIQDKWRTLQRVLKYSYQACTVQLAQKFDSVLLQGQASTGDILPVRALINPDKVKQDYDDKTISIDYAAGYGPGDVFEWKKTDTHWIIYLEEITEDAYFRGEIRRCRYKINFKDKEGNWCSTWAAIRGPVETTIDSIQKNQVRIDRPNLSLNILIPQNEKTLHAFDRYAEFLFAGRCWRVEAHDTISMKNIIEISAQEDYINRDTDDLENEMKNGLIFEEAHPDDQSIIQGETFIKPMIKETYIAPAAGGKWCTRERVPVTLIPLDDGSVELIWEKSTSGNLTLVWSDGQDEYEKAIVVESLF